MVTRSSALLWAREQLHGVDSPELESIVLLSFVLGISKEKIYTNYCAPLAREEWDRFSKLVEMRASGHPTAYLTGHKEFFGLDFEVDERVMIPRPETEFLVEEALKRCALPNSTIVDLGTGSGCIAVTLAKNLPQCKIYALDISEDAIEVARSNALRYGVEDKIEFLRGDLFAPIKSLGIRADMMLSNPPYIPTGEIPKLQVEIREHEPRVALNGGKDGLDFYRRIGEESPELLREGGLLIVEVGFGQSENVKEIFSATEAYETIDTVRDYSGAERIVIAERKSRWEGAVPTGRADEIKLGEIRELSVGEDDAGMRLDTFLSTRLPLSRTRIQKLIKEGRVSVNGATEKSSHRVSAGDRICIELPEPQKPSVEAEEIPLRILYEDKDVIVIDKPAGLTVHPAGGKISGTLVNALLYHCRDLSGIGGMARPGIVHRLDKDTSGVMVVAKNDGTHMALSKQIKDRSVEKRYIAVVCGNLKEDRGTIDAPIGRHPKDRKRMAVVGSGGRPARTEFEVKERFSGYTLLDLKPHTGRTHQIRVHLKHIGHPVVGDTAYGFRKREKLPIGRQALHAYLLGFIHPSTGKYVEFRADPPPDIAELIKHLRSKSSPHLRKQKERGDRDA